MSSEADCSPGVYVCSHRDERCGRITEKMDGQKTPDPNREVIAIDRQMGRHASTMRDPVTVLAGDILLTRLIIDTASRMISFQKSYITGVS